jgi:hypothetical protein
MLTIAIRSSKVCEKSAFFTFFVNKGSECSNRRDAFSLLSEFASNIPVRANSFMLYASFPTEYFVKKSFCPFP